MKVILFNGSRREKGCTYTALAEVEKALNANGVETEIYWIGQNSVSGCKGCWACKKTKKCVIDDGVNEFVEKCAQFDGFVFGSPVYYASAAGALVSFMDRVFYSGGKHNLTRILELMNNHEIHLGRVYSELPTLNDVFLEITGKELRD